MKSNNQSITPNHNFTKTLRMTHHISRSFRNGIEMSTNFQLRRTSLTSPSPGKLEGNAQSNTT